MSAKTWIKRIKRRSNATGLARVRPENRGTRYNSVSTNVDDEDSRTQVRRKLADQLSQRLNSPGGSGDDEDVPGLLIHPKPLLLRYLHQHPSCSSVADLPGLSPMSSTRASRHALGIGPRRPRRRSEQRERQDDAGRPVAQSCVCELRADRTSGRQGLVAPSWLTKG